MDNPYYNRNNIEFVRKKRTLHSLSVGFAFFTILFTLSKIFSVSLCPIKNIFNISCFGCGMTRAFIAILCLNFKTAFEYNVMSIPLFIAITVYAIFALADILLNKEFIVVIEKQLSKKYMYIIYFFILSISALLNNF